MEKNIKRKALFNRFSVLLLMAVFLFFLGGLPSKSVFKLDHPEILIINQRRSYYASPLTGKLMENKAGVIARKFIRNLFQGLDINYWFFANHPRERAGITETNKFYWLSIIPFLIGIYELLEKKKYFLFAYFFSALVLVSLFSGIDRYWYWFLPFFVSAIVTGFIKLLKIVKHAKD